MKKMDYDLKEITSYEYERLNETTRVIDENVSVDTLINICEFLQKKKVISPYKVDYPREKFISNMLCRTYTSPDYIPVVKEFLRSDYFSDLIKKSVYVLTSTLPNCEVINRLLKSDMHINDFPSSQVAEIRSIILDFVLARHEPSEYAMNSYIGLLHIYDDYMFSLDGLGPVNYIKSRYDKEGLIKAIICHSGLSQKNVRNYDRVNSVVFNENHILSIYQKFQKYIPQAVDDYVTLVDSMKKVSAYSFINSLYEYADNAYSCDNLDMLDDNITFDSFENLESEEQINIKNSFISMIEKSSKVLKLTNDKD